MSFRRVRTTTNSLMDVTHLYFIQSIHLCVVCFSKVFYSAVISRRSVRMFHFCGLILFVGATAVSIDLLFISERKKKAGALCGLSQDSRASNSGLFINCSVTGLRMAGNNDWWD